MRQDDAYEYFRAEISLGRDFRELTRTQQAVLALATLACLHEESGETEILNLAHSLNMAVDAVQTVIDELWDLGFAWRCGPGTFDESHVSTSVAFNLIPLAIGVGGRPSDKEWQKLKAQARARDSHAKLNCIYCRAEDVTLALDHLVPVARGGSNHLDNLAWACVPCNSAKRDKTYTEFMEARRDKGK